MNNWQVKIDEMRQNYRDANSSRKKVLNTFIWRGEHEQYDGKKKPLTTF